MFPIHEHNVISPDSLASLRAMIEELQEAEGPGAEYPAIKKQAEERITRGLAKSMNEALAQVFRADPELHARHRQSFSKRTAARVALVGALFDDALGPLVRGLQKDEIPARAAADMAWSFLPALHRARAVALEKARDGASVAELEKGHEARVQMVEVLVRAALRRQAVAARAGEPQSFRKCLNAVLGSIARQKGEGA